MNLRKRATPILGALALAVLLAALVFGHLDVRNDISEFLPRGESPAARLMLREMRSGSATTLILVGIERAPPADLARISQAMAAGLRASGQFALVTNSNQDIDDATERVIFTHRYLLSPASTAASFTTEALASDFKSVLDQMQSSLAPMARLGLADPTGTLHALLDVWAAGAHPRSLDGVWFAPDRDRALILLKTAGNGLDLAAQDRASAAIDAAFAAAKPGSARLLAAGPAVFARDAARDIRADVQLLSTVSALLVALLLLWRFRSPLVICAIAVPIVLSLTVAALVVQLAFGFVHGIALGFGMTMLGVTVDYPVLLIGHRKRGEAASGTLRRIGQAFTLAVATAAIGLTGMAFSGFPGLAQLGVFSVTGILAAAAATRFVLPLLIVAADLAPVSAGDPARLLRVERLRAWRWWALLPVAAATLWLVAIGGPAWENDVDNLSPVPLAARLLDQELRGEIGAPDVGQLVVVQGPSEQAVLEREETLLPRADALRQKGAISGVEAAAQLVPSLRTQLARRESLPAPDELAARVRAAQAGMPFRDNAFDAFLAGEAAARDQAPLRPEDIPGTLVAARLAPLLFERDGAWIGLIAFQGLRDPAALTAAFAGAPDAVVLDMRAETNAIVGAATRQAWRFLGFSFLLAMLVLAAVLRAPWTVARIGFVILGAGLMTVVVLTALGVRLSLLHLVALQFVAGVGLDYSLFFARRQLDIEERARTLRTLVTCNAMTLLTFGLLALCRTPLLRQIGDTVAIGAFLAILMGFLFVGPRPDADAGKPAKVES